LLQPGQFGLGLGNLLLEGLKLSGVVHLMLGAGELLAESLQPLLDRFDD